MPSTIEAVQTAVLRLALRLPGPIQRLISGPPVMVEGQRLAPDLQLMLRLQALSGRKPAEQRPWAAAREELALQARMVGGRQPIGSVRDITIEGPGGPLGLRLYTPTSRLNADRVPTMLFIHGGGMVYGGQHGTHDAACRFLAEQSGVQLLSVDYRLAPEDPYPTGVDDCIAAAEWMFEHTAQIDADPDRLAVGGDSAGGFFSAVVALAAAESGRKLAFQFLIYPVTDFVEESASRRTFGQGFFLTKEFMDGALAAFLPDPADRSRAEVNLVARTSFPEGLAPAFVATAGFDPLRDEGEAYAALLAEHGVAVEQKRFPGMIHGFLNMVAFGTDAPTCNRELAARLRAALA